MAETRKLAAILGGGCGRIQPAGRRRRGTDAGAAASAPESAPVSDSLPLSGAEYMGSACPTRPALSESERYRNRKKRGERLVDIRLTQEEIEKLAARGYVVEPGFPLAAVIEAFVSDLLACRGRNPP